MEGVSNEVASRILNWNLGWFHPPGGRGDARPPIHSRSRLYIFDQPGVRSPRLAEGRAVGSRVFMRYAIRLAVLLTVVSLVACSGDEPDPPPLAQRFVSAADAPGSTIDPVEVRETAKEIDAFVSLFSQHMVDADRDEMTTVFREAGFQEAGTEVRFYGETHSPDEPHIFSSFYELGSEDGATSALDWLVVDSGKPCPESCATVVSEFDVPGIPDASGVRRLTTAEAIETAGTEEQIPRDSYWMGFTVGSSVYTIEFAGPPGSVTVQQAREIASAYYERLAGD